MTLTSTATAHITRGTDAGLALLATIAFLALHALGGFASLTNFGADNDSLLRLVEVRDLIGGQNWFDLHQYRLGPAGGLLMHWSRLVDAPIAALILGLSAITGDPVRGEAAALVVWPTLSFMAAMFLLLRAARVLAGEAATFPALVLGAASLHFIGIFAPGALDHHNLQLVVALAMLCFLLQAQGRFAAVYGALAGTCAALLLAIAMEAAPLVAAGGVSVALWFLVDPATARRVAMAFGMAFGGLSLATFVATVPPVAWYATSCDAFSTVQLAIAGLTGFGLAAIAASPLARRSLPARLGCLAGLGALTALGLAVFFPQCLGDPYAGLDPRLRDWWLSAVTEAQPLWKILAVDPAMAAGYYATVLVALAYFAWTLWRHGVDRRHATVLAFLLVAFLVSLWQVRGSTFSIPFAVIPLAAFVGAQRGRATPNAAAATTLKLLAAWLISFNATWSAAAGGLSGVFDRTDQTRPAAGAAAATCSHAGAFDRLATMPAGGVLAVSNLGAPVLRYTPHRVLAGPYHRNVEGNLAVLDAFAGPAAQASEIAASHGMTFVAICRGDDESRVFSERAPDGLLAMLLRGEIPAWLEIVPDSQGEALELYRIGRRTD